MQYLTSFRYNQKSNIYSMLYTTICRTTCSFLNRAPAVLSRRGYNPGFWDNSSVVCNGSGGEGLLTARHFASISKAFGHQNLQKKNFSLKKIGTNNILNSHSRYLWQGNEEKDDHFLGAEGLRQKVLQQLQKGQVKVPDLRNVTSLPPLMDPYNSQLVALDLKSTMASPVSDLFSIHAVSDTEEFIKICEHDNDKSGFITESAGLHYDEYRRLCWSNGQPVETVRPKEALQEFINLLKKYDKPLIIYYSGGFNFALRLRYQCIHYDLYDELISACPYYIDVVYMVKKAIDPYRVPSFKLQDVCKEILDFDIQYGDQMSRLKGLKMLYTDYLLQTRIRPLVSCIDYYSAKDCYAQMVVDNEIHPMVAEKLARVGMRLDHLKFLKEQGEEEFTKELTKRNILTQDIGMLFSLV